MAQSLKVNYFFNLLSTITGLLFPLVTFPYVSRIIQADGIGLVSYYQTIIDYISLFSSIGIPIYAVRETSRVRNDGHLLSITLLEILFLHVMLTIIAYFFVFALAFSIDKIAENITLFILLSSSIILNTIGCNWFYQGIEEFKFITIRGLIFRFICVILLFCLVKDKDDLVFYALISVLGSAGNNLINFIYLKQKIRITDIKFSMLRPFRHLVPALKVFVLNLVISIYIGLDTIMLGSMTTTTAVGYYTGASKLTKMLLGLVSSLQTAMIPRCSNLVAEGRIEEFHAITQKVVDFVLFLTIPLSIGLAIMSDTLISLFCGPTFQPAIITLEILSPIIFLISLSGIPCFQILYPLGRESIAIASTATGALTNFIINLLLIPHLHENGAAIATVIAETVVTITMYAYGRKYIRVKKYDKHYINCFLAGAIMASILMFIRCIELDKWLNLLVMPICGCFIYGFVLWVRKDSFMLYTLELIKLRLNKC